jgi:hypothetical protein
MLWPRVLPPTTIETSRHESFIYGPGPDFQFRGTGTGPSCQDRALVPANLLYTQRHHVCVRTLAPRTHRTPSRSACTMPLLTGVLFDTTLQRRIVDNNQASRLLRSWLVAWGIFQSMISVPSLADGQSAWGFALHHKSHVTKFESQRRLYNAK